MDTNKWKKLYKILIFAAVFTVSCLMFMLFYQLDNKYTDGGPQASEGVLDLTGSSDYTGTGSVANGIDGSQAVFLVEGWEYYDGKLLTPEDFESTPPVSDEYIYIGQYGGFDGYDYDASPHGSASYRMTIKLPEGQNTYTLELPEIYSAYDAYINGKQVQSMGEPDPSSYYPETGNKSVSFEAAGEADILISVSDYSGLYSGMTYPPAFGDPEDVSKLLSGRLIFRSIFVAAAAIIGILAVFVGILSRQNKAAVLYGLLCLFFVGYTIYPIIKTLSSGYYFMYIAERFSFCAMMVALMILMRILLGEKAAWGRIFIGFGILMCILSIIVSLVLQEGNLILISVYSFLMMAFEWITAIYLTIITIRAVIREISYSSILLSGLLIFDAGLVMDRVLPLYEPGVTGWFPEIGSFLLILCIGIAVGRQIAEKYRSSAVLEERSRNLEQLNRLHRANYDLLMDRVEETKIIQHDLRHHSTMIEKYIQWKDYDGLKDYVRDLGLLTQILEPVDVSKNIVAGTLVEHYKRIAGQNGIIMKTSVDLEKEIEMSDADLCAVLSNLLENSIEACLRQMEGERFIDLYMKQTPSAISIRIENSTDGYISDKQNMFTSSKGGEGHGYGLESVKMIAKRYGGSAEFKYDSYKKVFVSTVLLYILH